MLPPYVKKEEVRLMKPFIVYGTLRPGHGNYAWALAGRTLSEEDIMVENARLTSNGGFPYLIPTDGEQAVATLVTVDERFYEDTLENLDSLEGYRPGSSQNLYDRISITVQDSTGVDVEAWLYVPAEGTLAYAKTLPAVPGNDWNQWVDTRPPFPKRSWTTV